MNKPQKIIMGCDPGLSGAVAGLWINDSWGIDGLRVDDMPTMVIKSGKKEQQHISAAGLAALIKDYGRVSSATVELVGAMPGQGVTSMFRFGYAAGLLHGCLGACGVPVETITPQEWKRMVRLIGENKDASRFRAQQLFPDYAGLFARVKDNGRADAVLIAFSAYLKERASMAGIKSTA
jgi:crossover junction endodeoxyribonuclease RuvC